MKTVLSFVAALILAPSAFASHGVEKMLPLDAHNVSLVKAKVAQYPIGSKDVSSSNTGVQNEGYPSSETVFGSKLEATFAYDSQDSNAQGSGPDGQTYSWDHSRSTAVVALSVPASTIAAIQDGSVNAKDLIGYSVRAKQVTTSQQTYSNCDENTGVANEGYPGDNGGCQVTTTPVKVTAPILSVYLK